MQNYVFYTFTYPVWLCVSVVSAISWCHTTNGCGPQWPPRRPARMETLCSSVLSESRYLTRDSNHQILHKKIKISYCDPSIQVQSTLDISKFRGLFFTSSNYSKCKLICTSGNLDLQKCIQRQIMVVESNQNIFFIHIVASSLAEFEISEFEISRVNCIRKENNKKML